MLNKGILLGEKIKLYNIIRGSVSNVSLSYSPQTDIKAGTTVNITVNANSGYQNPWVTVSKNDGTGNVTVNGSGSNRSFVMPKSDVTITAGASVIPTYSVFGNASGGGISFSKTSGIRAGEVITVYLTPNTYHTLSSLTSNPSVGFSGRGNTRTFVMPNSNITVNATFVAQYTHSMVFGYYKKGSNQRWGWSQGDCGSISNRYLNSYLMRGFYRVNTERFNRLMITLDTPNVKINVKATLLNTGTIFYFEEPFTQEGFSITEVRCTSSSTGDIFEYPFDGTQNALNETLYWKLEIY